MWKKTIPSDTVAYFTRHQQQTRTGTLLPSSGGDMKTHGILAYLEIYSKNTQSIMNAEQFYSRT